MTRIVARIAVALVTAFTIDRSERLYARLFAVAVAV
jgi:hypothetical protein